MRSIEVAEVGWDPAGAGFDGVYEVEVVILAEDIAVVGEALDSECGEVGACDGRGVTMQAVEELDPGDGDGLVVATGGGVLAADSDVVAADALAHVVGGERGTVCVDVAGSGEEMRAVRPAGLGERAVLEGAEKGVDLGFCCGERVHLS